MQTISMGPNPMLDAGADAEAAAASWCVHTLSREVEKWAGMIRLTQLNLC